ncbi:MAG: adenylosuccinate lyase [Thermovirgaceae bacterium]|nr:adenylosuccinate lyase [Thermovirgaceae bacterium]
MIERYSTEEMSAIWSQNNRFRTWLEVEIAACRAWMEEGSIPEDSFRNIVERSGIDLDRIRQIEDSVHHDMVAFVSSVAEKVGPDGRYIHLGLTSSDVIDTSSSILLSRSIDIILSELLKVSEIILENAWKFRKLACVGRTHGVHAEPLSFGFKLLNWYEELQRDVRRLDTARLAVSVGKISGAVGTYAHCPPAIEERVCALLGLERARVSTQVLQRDRHAEVMSALALLGSGLERIAQEIRHLQRTEVLEVLEPFSMHQKGSSAMPHKKNPVICERICGMARLLRGYALSSMENIPLWHERDISHSSVERVIWPDAFHISHYMLVKTREVLEGMTVLEDGMKRNLDLSKGLVFSQRVLIGLVEKGFTRENAYAIVQESAMKCWEGEKTFLEILEEDPAIMKNFKPEELESLFEADYYLRFIDTIFDRFPKPGGHSS